MAASFGAVISAAIRLTPHDRVRRQGNAYEKAVPVSLQELPGHLVVEADVGKSEALSGVGVQELDHVRQV